MIPSRKAAALVLLAALSLRMYDVHAQHTDQQIAATLMVANRAEIEAGNLALSRSQRRSIQNFAGKMIAEHRDLYQSAVELTQRLMLYPEGLWCKFGRRARNRPFFMDLNELKEPPSRSRAKWYL
ncbi:MULTISPECIES: DUF4142 domain-containing protein [Paraburkholderia]|uniref:DUF4142 domain-containing protein n=1 Tax=Paraburkholderia TaxID=1822464 RepID=UPI001FE6A5A3|nr:DUF4142 domain-containing protein [Paraburkholderia podalyriae]